MKPADQLLPEDSTDWAEFCQWMEQDPNEECLYIWLAFRDGTFHLDPERAKEKALERFRIWQNRKKGVALARANLKLVPKTSPSPKPKLNLDLKDLLP